METTNNDAALDVVLKFHRAWTTGKVDDAMEHVADTFVCRGPDGAMPKAAYRDYLANFVQHLTGAPEVARFAQGDEVALIYYPQTAVTTTTPAAEYFTVRNGVIAESMLMFDRLSYAPPQHA